MTQVAPKASGRLLAWTALLIALAASVAANVAFARPTLGPRLSSGVAPVLVVLAAGLLERVPLADVRWWRRLLAYGGLGVVVTAAFVTSFEHQYRLLVQYGNPALSAVLLPVAVDGLIVLASVCLTVIAERRRNSAAAPVTEAIPQLVSEPASDTVTDTDSQPKQPKRPRRQLTTAERVARLREQQPDLAVSVIAKRVGVSERTVSRHLATLAATTEPASVNGAEVPGLVSVSN